MEKHIDTIHFLETKEGYQFLSSTAYNEREFEEWEILQHKSKLMSNLEIKKLYELTLKNVVDKIQNILESN